MRPLFACNLGRMLEFDVSGLLSMDGWSSHLWWRFVGVAVVALVVAAGVAMVGWARTVLAGHFRGPSLELPQLEGALASFEFVVEHARSRPAAAERTLVEASRQVEREWPRLRPQERVQVAKARRALGPKVFVIRHWRTAASARRVTAPPRPGA